MLNITITDTTPANMLRAIKAACDELLGTAVPLDEQAATHAGRANELIAAANTESEQAARCLTALNASTGTVLDLSTYDALPSSGAVRVERSVVVQTETGIHKLTEGGVHDLGDVTVAVSMPDDVDSAGQRWDPNLHSSSRAKISDGTWKKRRNIGGPLPTPPAPEKEAAEAPTHAPIPPVPPLPPADTMKRIFALITAQVCTLNDVLAAAAEHDIKDLGQNGLTGASAEVQLAVLRKLESA